MRNGYLIKGLAILIILLFIGMGANPLASSITDKEPKIAMLNGNTLYVGGNGTGNYSDIQTAIYEASAGDTIFVFDYSSPYKENLFIDKSIILIGEDKKTTVIDGNYGINTIYINANFVTVMEFSIINSNYSGILLSESEGCSIYLNIIKNNGCGIKIQDSSNGNIIYNNNFIDNYMNAYDECNNKWNKPFPTGGNYWSDYKEQNPDAKRKLFGYWNEPYLIPPFLRDGGGNSDNLPTVKPNSMGKSYNPQFKLLNLCFERFPNIFPILRNLLKLN